jgi:hypothetical protein
MIDPFKIQKNMKEMNWAMFSSVAFGSTIASTHLGKRVVL